MEQPKNPCDKPKQKTHGLLNECECGVDLRLHKLSPEPVTIPQRKETHCNAWAPNPGGTGSFCVNCGWQRHEHPLNSRSVPGVSFKAKEPTNAA